MARVAVVGVGAIGGSVAAAVDDAGAHDLIACVRRSLQRIVVERHDGARELTAVVCTDPDQLEGPVDWVMLATKAYQSEGARPWLDRLGTAGTTVAVLQNGIDHVERIQPLAPEATILPVVVYIPAEADGPGRIRQSRPGQLIVPDTGPGRAFADLLAASDTEVRLVEDFTTALWSKLITNAAMGAVALTRQRNGIATGPSLGPELRELMAESLAVARAAGARLDDDVADQVMARVGYASDHLSSITNDVVSGRPLEWETRNAVIGRLGRRHGIPTPRNDLLTALLRTVSESVSG